MQRPVIVAFASWLWPCRRRRSSNTATARAGPRQPSSVHTSLGSMGKQIAIKLDNLELAAL